MNFFYFYIFMSMQFWCLYAQDCVVYCGIFLLFFFVRKKNIFEKKFSPQHFSFSFFFFSSLIKFDSLNEKVIWQTAFFNLKLYFHPQIPILFSILFPIQMNCSLKDSKSNEENSFSRYFLQHLFVNPVIVG